MNQWTTPRKRSTGSNLVDMGWVAVHGPVPSGTGPTPKPDLFAGGEATPNACGVGVAMPSGYSWVPPRPIDCVVNVGTVPGRPDCRATSPDGGRPVVEPMAAGQGGGPVVVRAGESPAHGEGDQQVSKEEIGMPGGRW